VFDIGKYKLHFGYVWRKNLRNAVRRRNQSSGPTLCNISGPFSFENETLSSSVFRDLNSAF